MSVTRTNTPSTTVAAAARAATTSAAVMHTTGEQPATERTTRTATSGHASSSSSTRDAARGAHAAPQGVAGATDANAGVAETQSPVPVMGTAAADAGTYPTSPAEASAAAYADATGTATVQVAGTGAWTGDWQRRFEKLQLKPEDIQYLAAGGFDDAALQQIATQLEQVDPIVPATAGTPATAATPVSAPTPGVDAGAAASADASTASVVNPKWASEYQAKMTAELAKQGWAPNDIAAALPADQMSTLGDAQLEAVYQAIIKDGTDAAAAGSASPSADPTEAVTSAWDKSWETKFTKVMTAQGVPAADIATQIKQASESPMTQEQLGEAYRQMEQSLGDYDQGWKDKFTTLFGELKAPAADQTAKLQELATNGLTDAQLQKEFDSIAANKPGWNDDFRAKFVALDLPKEYFQSIVDSGASTAGLQSQYDSLLDTKMKYYNDGKLKKLMDAGASDDERWGIMLGGTQGKEFDKKLEQVRSSHVSGWRKIGSMALNMVPGVFAVNYLIGKDMLTGDKIDRTNPLNVLGAAASGFAAFSAVRTAVTGVRGLMAANSTWQAGKAGAGLTQAVEAAGLTSRFNSGLRIVDYAKAATPLINRFGQAKALASVGQGYAQAIKLVAGASALEKGVKGAVTVNKEIKVSVASRLRQGESIDTIMGDVTRSKGALTNSQVSKLWNENAFLQKSSGTFKMNPFKREARVAVGEMGSSGVRTVELGRGVNFGTRAGLSQGLGSLQYANVAKLNSGAMAGALNMAGVDAGAIKAVGAEGAYQLRWADRLGVTSGGPTRFLHQITGSGQEIGRLSRGAKFADNKVYAAVSRLAQVPSNSRLIIPGLTVGMVAGVGLSGKAIQPWWEEIKHYSENQRLQRERNAAADAELAELEQIQTERNAAGAGGATATSAPGAPGADMTPAVVGVAPDGAQITFDPASGSYYNAANGDQYDPETGTITGKLGQQPAAAVGSAAAGTTDAAGAGMVTDPTTGYVTDTQSGYVLDPKTNNVYDPTSGTLRLIGNLNDATTTTAA